MQLFLKGLKLLSRAKEPRSLEYFLTEDEDVILIEIENGSSEETFRACKQAHLMSELIHGFEITLRKTEYIDRPRQE